MIHFGFNHCNVKRFLTQKIDIILHLIIYPAKLVTVHSFR